MTKPDSHVHEVFALARACQAKLSRHKPEVQGGALATLLAAWVTSCFVEDDPEATKRVRKDILRDHFDHVRHLVEVVESVPKETLQ